MDAYFFLHCSPTLFLKQHLSPNSQLFSLTESFTSPLVLQCLMGLQACTAWCWGSPLELLIVRQVLYLLSPPPALCAQPRPSSRSALPFYLHSHCFRWDFVFGDQARTLERSKYLLILFFVLASQ